MNCTAIHAEVASNNQKIEQLAKDNGWKVAQNVAAGDVAPNFYPA